MVESGRYIGMETERGRQLKIKLTGCILFLILQTSAACLAQVVNPDETEETVSVFTGAQFYYRTLEGERDETVQQLVFPFFASAAVTDSLGIRIYQTFSRSELEDGPSLEGLGSTRIRCSLSLFGNRFLTYLGLGLPIDEATPELETEDLSDLLYLEPLQFGVNRLTEGFDVDGGFAFVQPFGRLSFGIGAGYALRGSYDRLGQDEELFSYSPGDVASATAGLHFFTRAMSLHGGASYIYYAEDTIDAGESFENGDELSFSIATRFQPGPLTITLYGADTIKGDTDASAGAEITNPFTNRLNTGISLAYSLFSDTFILKTQAKVKWFTDEGEADAKIATLGGGFDLVITDNMKLDVLAGYMIGDMDAGVTDISGFNLSSVIRVGF
jgi:hypothetical protein